MPSLYDRFNLVSDFELAGDQAARDWRADRRARARRSAPGAARRHRVGQDVHDGADHRAREPADAGDGPQQDPGGAAVPGVPALLSRERRRVLRQLLRLLPAGGLRPGDRLLHREGSDDQRRDRSHAAVGHALALRAPRRHHRRQRVVHLRPRFAGGVLRDAAAARARPADQPRARSSASSSRSSTSATTTTSGAAPSACAATSSRCIRRTKSTGLRIELFGDEVDELASFDPLTGKTLRRHDKIAVYPKSHFVAPRERTRTGGRDDQGGARLVPLASSKARASCSRRSACTSGRCSTSR